MPQVDKVIVKERAAKLRGKGELALARFLDAQIGTSQRVLIERPGLGRLDSFAEIRVERTFAGQTVNAAVTGRHGGHLVGRLL
jgi:threonylcarbamoyladenosine tRNA methylthiotransferase MtaB